MPFSKVLGKNNQHKVVVFALSTCVWCKMTKQYLKDNEVEFEFIDVDLTEPEEKQEIHELIQDKGGTLSYPTIIVDDKKIITGFRKDQLKEALQL
jgi:glutaredoxin